LLGYLGVFSAVIALAFAAPARAQRRPGR